ncbi:MULTISPECIES: ferredoxin [Pseudonocardia]|uniref:Ferredoxin n=2 Tax=Pseudonocardia TaxID=1847 RepID=A0A1Y2MW51_PSEAH|nr:MULTISPECIES: ferredoxin [Pseudonocardia]OSY38858.1 Ferredoxin-2 [Pseudonocardia autotrophica]TDN76114.1 ferredoxin [Pseudonocardia autotrophica]BBG00095.1 hypothetical protein Pdca_13040 [Pseudonocardia autotrophica]GEC26060.1 hypothetical protein PSA01_30890 [Pseudonocardia saturnea]
MSYRVHIDETLCFGYGNCMVTAPEVFDLDADTSIAVVLPGRPVDEDGPALREAVADCPARAIALHRT